MNQRAEAQVTLAGWEMNGLSAYGASPLAATTTAANVTIGGLTRGAGLTTSGTAAGNAWGGNGMDETSFANAIAGNDFASFTVTAASGYAVSLSGIAAYNIRRSGTGPTSGQWQYQIGAGAFNNIGSTITWGTNTAAAGNSQAAIDLSGIGALQNVAAGTTITIRCVIWGGSAANGTWYINNFQTGDDFIVTGTVSSTSTPEIIVTPASFNFGNSNVGATSASETFSISGNNLTGAPGNITITAPSTDFQVSSDNAAFSGSINIAYTGSSLSATNFYVRFSPQTGGAKSGNLGFSGGGVSTPPTIALSGTGVITYYTKTATATGLQNTSSWTTDASGGAGTEPANFTADAQIFSISNNATTTISGNWTVSGSGSKIIVASGDFTIPSSASVTGTIDVNAGAELTIENATVPTLGTLAATSTVQYNDVAITLPASTTFGNLTLSGTGTKTFPGNTTTIAGNFLVNNTTIDGPSGSPFGTILLSGNLTYQGTVVSPAATNSITLQTDGAAAGTQTFTGNGNTIRYFRIQTTTANTLLMSTTGGSTHILVGNGAGGGITLVDGSVLNLNGNDLEFFDGGGANLLLNATGSVSAGATTNLTFARGGTATLGTLRMTSGANTVRSLTLNHSGSNNTNLTLANDINVTETVNLTSGTLISNGNLTLKSTSATATATVVGGTNASITGDVTVERFLPWASANNSGFRFVSHPLASNPVINTVTNLPTATNTLVGYNEGNDAYEAISNRSANWPQGIGYGVWNNAANTLSFTGALQLSDVAAINMGNASNRWNFAGNPFASTLDWDAVTRTDMQNAVWVWVKDDVAVGGGAWASYIDGVAANGGSRYIAPMQGFMVRAMASGTPSLAYPAAARVSNQTPSYQRTQSAGDIYRVKVSNANNSSLETVIRFLPNATEDHDASYDAEFVSDYFNGTPDLYTTDAQGVKYSINSLPALGVESVMVPLQLETFGAGSFNFTFDASEMLTATRVQFEDRRTGTFTDLAHGQVVSITVGNNEAADRFRLHFNSTGAATSVSENAANLIQMYAHEGALYIRGVEQAESLRILDISGRTVYALQQLSLDGNAIRPNLAKGTYVVQLVSGSSVKTVKVIF